MVIPENSSQYQKLHMIDATIMKMSGVVSDIGDDADELEEEQRG